MYRLDSKVPTVRNASTVVLVFLCWL